MQMRNYPTTSASPELQEAHYLIEISRNLFQKKLSAFKHQVSRAKDEKEKEELLTQANKLHADYLHSLEVIKEYTLSNLEN